MTNVTRLWTWKEVEQKLHEAWNDGAKNAYLESAKIAKRYREEFPDDADLLTVLEELFTECADMREIASAG